jgi:hypothetical protein
VRGARSDRAKGFITDRFFTTKGTGLQSLRTINVHFTGDTTKVCAKLTA